MKTPSAVTRRSVAARTACLGVGLLLGAASGVLADPAPIPRDATFRAHEVHDGLVVDRNADGATGFVPSVAGAHWGEPAFEVHERGGTATLEVPSTGHVVVAGPGPAQRETVEPSWENNAIQLSLHSQTAPPLRTDVFRRTDTQAGPSLLTRQEGTTIDLRGTYEATLHGADGRPVGWLRLRLGEDQPGHVQYEAAFPPEVDAPMAIAAAEALGSEVAWIESHTTGVTRSPENRP